MNSLDGTAKVAAVGDSATTISPEGVLQKKILLGGV